MNNSINPVSSTNYVSLKGVSKVKLRENEEPQTEKENISFCGTSALASYNKAFINKNEEVFNLPILKPIDIPTDINKISGERIYNSDGKLVRIEANDGNNKITYNLNENKIGNVDIIENNTGTKWSMDYDSETGKIWSVAKTLPDGTEFWTNYDGEDGSLESVRKEYETADGKTVDLSYYPKDKIYIVEETKGDNHLSKTYNSNRNLKTVNEWNQTKDTYIRYLNGVPYKIETSASRILNADVGKDDLDLSDLNPYPDYKFVLDKNSIEGEKKYYSNGQLEKIITKTGTEYVFDLDGNINSIKDRNKTIDFGYSDNKFLFKDIKEIMPDGAEKTTKYWSDGEYSVMHKKDNIEQKIDFYDNGFIRSYHKTVNNEDIIDRYYDRNGNLTNCWDE